MSSIMDSLLRRAHIQEHSNTSISEPHWGYVDRTLPCTNDAGSCEYLDAVYLMHDVSSKSKRICPISRTAHRYTIPKPPNF
jgi:hypothetical protein